MFLGGSLKNKAQILQIITYLSNVKNTLFKETAHLFPALMEYLITDHALIKNKQKSEYIFKKFI